jgi:hypothetical protein
MLTDAMTEAQVMAAGRALARLEGERNTVRA